MDGFGFLSNLKNSKDPPLIKMQWIGNDIFKERLSRSQPMHPGQRAKKWKPETQGSPPHSAITWAIASRRSWSSLCRISMTRIAIAPKAWKKYSVILCTNNRSLRAIPQCESEQINEMVKNLLVLVNFRGRTRIWLNSRTGERNLDLASSVWWSRGGPNCINMISMSITIDLKMCVGIRERWISKVPMSLNNLLGISPTRGATCW